MFPNLLSPQVKATMLIYLTMSAYAEQSLYQLAKMATISGNSKAHDEHLVARNLEYRDGTNSSLIQETHALDFNDIMDFASNSTDIDDDDDEATPLIIPYEGTHGCSTDNKAIFVEMDGETFELMTLNGTTLCNDDDAEEVARKAFNNHEHLQKRVSLNPTIIKYSVTVLESSVFAGSISLATLGGITAIGLALFGLWYGATKLIGKATDNSKRDDGSDYDDEDTAIASPDIAASNSPRGMQPVSRAALVERSSKKYYVSFSDENTSTKTVDNENKKRDKKGAKHCIKKLSKKKTGGKKAAGGCCTYMLKAKDGTKYNSQIGAAVKGTKDSTFNCWD